MIEGLSEPQRETVRFVEVVTGWTVADAPPPPGSPLAQLIERLDREDDQQTP